MANIDTNSWYRFTIGDDFLIGSDLGTQSGTGVTYWTSIKTWNANDNSHVWQFFPMNATYYVLRTRTEPLGYLNAKVEYNASVVPAGVVGQTVTYMANSSLSDESMFWTIYPREDGLFYLTNKANGTSFHLDSIGWAWMNSNVTSRQSSQGFSFVKMGKIDDQRYSSVVLPQALATAPPTGTGTTSPTPIATDLPGETSLASQKSGLSSGAKGGIGAAVGVAALLVFIAIGFLFYRRKKRRIVAGTHVVLDEEPKGPRELDSHLQPKMQYEMEVPPVELESSAMLPEMSSESRRRG